MFILRILIALVIFNILTLKTKAEEKSPEFVLKLGTLAPEGSIYMQLMHEFWDKVYERSGGRLKMSFYAGGIMGDEPDMLKMMRNNKLHAGAFASHGVISIAPDIAVTGLPFMFESMDEVDYVRKKMFGTFSRIFEEKGFFLLTWIDDGGLSNLYSKNPVNSLEELKKEKVWAWAGEPIGIEIVKSLGITPITLPVPEVIPALERGKITVIDTNPLACVALQWHSHIKYVLLLNFRYELGAVIFTSNAWNGLPPELQKIIIDVNEEMMPKMLSAIRLSSNKSLEAMVAQGIKIIKFSDEEKNKMKTMTRKIYNELADKLYRRSVLDEIQGYIKEYREGGR